MLLQQNKPLDQTADQLPSFSMSDPTISFLEEVVPSFTERYEVEIKFLKTHPNAKLPEKAYSDFDNCFDLFCVEETTVPAFSCLSNTGQVGTAIVPVGLTVAYITPGFGFVVKDKSGHGIVRNLSHFGGEIDGGYRGDLAICISNFSSKPHTFEVGDKVAQIKVEKIYKTRLSFADEIVETCKRGEGGFGSSGR